jgi:predicted nucleic acid-binding protein
MARMARLVRQYADLGLGASDASTVALAERLGLVEVATLDRRHFTVIRPEHCSAFSLLPKLS